MYGLRYKHIRIKDQQIDLKRDIIQTKIKQKIDISYYCLFKIFNKIILTRAIFLLTIELKNNLKTI